MTTNEKAYAKLNISLDITGKLPDGFHAMRMIMQTCTLCDELEISITDDGNFSCESGLSYLPTDEKNLAVSAAKLFFKEADIKDRGVHIVMKKQIPICAGLGGGSSDAAAVLRALNRMTDTGFSIERLEKMGSLLGSDVPFCVRGKTALAEGKGEILTPLSDMPVCYIVICKPDFAISTPALFKKVGLDKLKFSPDTQGIISALNDGDLVGVTRRMYNVFEDILPRKYSEVIEIKNRLLTLGAMGAVMTGTGSAAYGVFADEETAADAYNRLSADYDSCFLCRTI